MEIPTRAGREAVELLTEAEATAFINRDKETIKTELNRLTFVPLAPRPAEAPVPNHLAERLRLATELDEARRKLDEQVAERAAADSAANAAFKAVEAARDAHLATSREKDSEIASLNARLRGVRASEEKDESEDEELSAAYARMQAPSTKPAARKPATARKPRRKGSPNPDPVPKRPRSRGAHDMVDDN